MTCSTTHRFTIIGDNPEEVVKKTKEYLEEIGAKDSDAIAVGLDNRKEDWEELYGPQPPSYAFANYLPPKKPEPSVPVKEKWWKFWK